MPIARLSEPDSQSLIVTNTVGLAGVELVSFNRVQRHYAGLLNQAD